MGKAIWVSTMNFIALGSWNFVDQAGAQRWPVGPAASMCNVYWRAHVAASGIAQHDAATLEAGSGGGTVVRRPEAALDVEHLVHNLRTVCEEGAG